MLNVLYATKAPSSLRTAFAALTLILSLTACSKPLTVQTYSKNGVQFSYYSNWKLDKDAAVAGNTNVRSIVIKGPHHAIVNLICVPAASTQTLEQFAEAVAIRRKAKIENRLSIGSLKTADVDKGTSESIAAKVGGSEQKGIHQQFSIDLLGKVVPHDVRFFGLQGTKIKMMIMSQTPQEHIATAQPGIDLILDSVRIDVPD